MAKKILIIEDSEEMRVMEQTILEDAGYEVVVAAKADDGILLAEQEQPDLILMDIRLPNKKRGIGAAKILRKNEKTQDIPIIFVTGYGKGDQTREIKNIPNCGYLVKPVDRKVFFDCIEKYLK